MIVTHIGETSPKVIKQGDLELGITSYQLFRRIARDAIYALDLPRLARSGGGHARARQRRAEAALSRSLRRLEERASARDPAGRLRSAGRRHGPDAQPHARDGRRVRARMAHDRE